MNYNWLFNNFIPFIKNFVGIKNISLSIKRWNKRFGRLIYHKKYTADDIISIMKSMGMQEGSVICIHASMMQFYNYEGTAQELIDKIIKVIGKEGTLMMPALPERNGKNFDEYIFDPKNDKTSAGYLAETFRKNPGVLRSNNAQHSVCAIGKYASYLVKDHTNGVDCWDKISPWFRLTELKGLVFNLGLPRNYMGTFHHCVESILKDEHPYWKQFFNKQQTFKYLDENGSIVLYKGFMLDGIIRRTRERKIFKYFSLDDWKIKRISNLEIKVFYSDSALNKMLELGRKGIAVYYLPSPKRYKFEISNK